MIHINETVVKCGFTLCTCTCSSISLFQPSTGSRDSDEDSLLNSDDDYEGERDAFFTRHKKKRRYNLQKKRGIEEFKTFLINTRGETNWNLWIDIDRARLIKDENKLVM